MESLGPMDHKQLWHMLEAHNSTERIKLNLLDNNDA